jgi:hypothetical protein
MTVIRNILNKKLSELDATLPIAWENVSFTPPADRSHVRVSFLPARTRAAANHRSALDFESGEYQIDIYVPQNQGTAAADALVKSIKAHFYRGLRLTASTTVAHIEQTPSEATGQREGPFWRSRVIVPYFAYIPAAS